MDANVWEHFLCYLGRIKSSQQNTLHKNAVELNSLDVPTDGNTEKVEGMADLLKQCSLKETKSVIVLSSDSETDDDSIWSNNAKCKSYKRICENVHALVFHRILGSFYQCTNGTLFPYEKLRILSDDLRKFQQVFIHNEEELKYLWRNVVQWLLALKQSSDPTELKYDENFILILIDFMAQYINYVTSTFYKINESVKINETVNEIVQTLAAVLGGSILHILLVLLRIELKIEYRSILNPIFRKYLCDHSLCRASSDLIVYLRLILCFKRWKMITPLKADREAINELAVGKSIRSKKAECSIDLIDLTTEPILPKSVPKVNVKNRLFISISDLIGFAMEKEAYGTRILLIYTSLDLEDAITKYFQCYKRYVSLNADCLSMDVDPPSKEMSKLNLQPENYTLLTQRNYNDAAPSRPQRRREQQNKDQQVVEKQSMDFTPHLNSNCYINKIRLSNLSNSNESTLRLKTTNAQSDISLRSKNNSFKDNLECIQIDLTAFDKDHIPEDDHDKEQDNDNDNDNDNINDNDNENNNDNDNDNGNDNHNDNDNENNNNNNNNDNDNENDNDNNDNDNDNLKKVLEKSDSDTVSRQNLITNENALGTEPSSMPRIAAVPPRCRHLVESVATKPTRKEKHCIPGEVSSTTSSDYLLQTNIAQNIRTALEHNTTPSVFQYNVSSLEVHSAGTLQNAREVGVVKVIQQRVSPCPSVVVSGTCKPGSLLLGVNTSDVSSENEDNDLDCNSHIMSHALWKVVEEATSSTAEFPKTLPENALLLTRNEIKSKHSVANTKSKELEERKISMDGPMCSKYIEKTYTPLATSVKALDVPRAEEIIRTDEHLSLSLKTKSVIQEHDHEENPIEKNVGQDEIKKSQSLEYIKTNVDLGTDMSTKTVLENTIESTPTFKFLSESKTDAIKNIETHSVQCTNEKTTLNKQNDENIPPTEINVNDTTINPFVEVVKLVPGKEQFVVENRISDEQTNLTKDYDDTVDVEANDIESFLKEIDENLNEAERDDSNCFIETGSKQKLSNTKNNSTFYGDDFTNETANNSEVKNYSIENRKQDESAEFCMDVENAELNNTNENEKETQNSSRIISEETIEISNLLDGKNKIPDVKSKEDEDKITTEDDRFTVKMLKLRSSKSYHENITAIMQTNTSNDKNIDFIDLNNEMKLNKQIMDISKTYGQNNESVTKDSKSAYNSPVIPPVILNTVPILNRVKTLNKNNNEMDELSDLNIAESREEENVAIETSQVLMTNTKGDIDSTICVNPDKTKDNINGSAECINSEPKDFNDLGLNKDFGDISERKGHVEVGKTYSKDISIVSIKNSVEDTNAQISMNSIDECNKQSNLSVEKYLKALNIETKPKSQLKNKDVNETNEAAHPNARDINVFSGNDAANTLTNKSENMDNVMKSTREGNTPKTVTLGSLSIDIYTPAILKANVRPEEGEIDLMPEDQIITSEMKVEESDSKSTLSGKFKNLENKCWTSKISERISISVPQTVCESKLDELQISSLVNTTNKIEEGVNTGDTDESLINLNEIKKSRIELKNTETDNNNICTVDTKGNKISTVNELSSNKSKNEYIEAISENVARAQFSDENTTYLNQSDTNEKLVPEIIHFSTECLNFSKIQIEEFEGVNRNSEETLKVVAKNSLESVELITLSDKQEILSSVEETVCPEQRTKFHSNGEEQLIMIGNNNNTALTLEDESVFATKQSDEDEKKEEIKDGNNSETNILYSNTQNEEFEGENRNSEETSKVVSKNSLEIVEHITLSDKQEILSSVEETICPEKRIKVHSNGEEQLIMIGNNNNTALTLEDESVQSDEDEKKEEIKDGNNCETNILYSKIQDEQFEWENRYSKEISKVVSKTLLQSVEHKTFSDKKEVLSSFEETVGPEQRIMSESEYGEKLIMSGNNNNTALIVEDESVFAEKQNDEGEEKEDIHDGNNSETNIVSRADVLEDENTYLAEEKSKEDTAKDSSAQEEECIFNEQNLDSQRLKTEFDLKSRAPHSSTQHIDFQTPEKDIEQVNRNSNKIIKKYNKKSARGNEESSNQSRNDYIEAISENIIRAEFSDESTYINESDTNEKVGSEIIDTNQECSNINIQNEEFEGETTNSEETSNVFPKNLLESVEHITLSDKQEIVNSIEEIVGQKQRIMSDSECGEQLIMSGNNNKKALILEDESVFASKQKDEDEKMEEITYDNNGETNVTRSKSQNEEFEWENRYSEEISKVEISNKQLIMSGNYNNTALIVEDESVFAAKQNDEGEEKEDIHDGNNSETNILSRADVLEDENTYLAEEKSKEDTAKDSSAQEEECIFNEQNLDSQRLKTEFDLKSRAPHSSTQHIDFQTPEKDIEQVNRNSNKIIKKYNKKSARGNEESSNQSKNDYIEAISENIIRAEFSDESTYINESDTNEKVAPEIIDSNKECSNMSIIQNKEFEWENRYSEEISKVVPTNVLESIEHKTLNDKQEILSSIEETVAPEQRIMSNSECGEQLIMSGNNNNTALTPEDESVFATGQNDEGEKKEEITDGNSSETNILCSKIQNEEFEWENRYAEEISKAVPKNLLESVEHKTFSDKQEILNSIEETVAPEQRILSESEYGEKLIMSGNNNNTALILEDESVFTTKQNNEDEKMQEITDDKSGETNILVRADALGDENTSLTGENSKEDMAKNSSSQEDESICNEPNLDSLTETKISEENIDDNRRNNSVTLKNLIVTTTQIVSQCALYDSLRTEESTNVDHYDNDEVEKRASSTTQEEKYIENVNYESSGAAMFDMMQKSDISSKITENIVTKEIPKVQENIEPESLQSILTTLEIKATRENIEDTEILSISKDLITNYETNKVISEVDLCSSDHKERRNLAPSSNVPEDIDYDLSKAYQRGDETQTNFDFEKRSLLKNNEKNEKEKTALTDTAQGNCQRSRHGSGTPLLDEELDDYVHRSTQESAVLKNVERNIYTSDNNNVTNSLTICKDIISSKSIHSLPDDDIEKRTPWKMRIKRRISLCSDINKEFNLDSNEDDKQILRTNDITDSEQRITRSTVRKVADERADDISKLNKKRMNHNSESDGSNADDGFDCVQDSWLNQLGLLKNTTKNIVAPNENITNVFIQKLEEKSKQQKEKNYTSEATASLSLNQMPINYKSEEIVAVSALLHMQNKRFNRTNADLSEQETINEIEALTSSKGRRGRPRKPMTRQSSSRMNAARVIQPEPILKSALKKECRSKSSVQKKVTFDMRSDLQVEEKNEFRKWNKAFNNLKAFRSAEGSLLKGGNKQTKRRLDEINARFKLDSISAITKGEDSSGIINLCKSNNTKETMISIEQSQYQKVRKRKISNITTRGDISHPGSTMLSRSASKSMNRNKKLMGEDVIEILNPTIISPKNRNDTGNCSEVHKSSCEFKVLNSTSNKLFDNKANITTQPTTANDLLMVKDELSSARKAPEQHTNLVVSTEVDVRTLEEKIQLAEPEKYSTQKHTEKKESLVVHRTRSSKRKRAVVRVRRLDSTKSDATCPLNDAEAVEMGFNFEEKKIKKEPEDECTDPIYNASDVTIKREEDCTVPNDCFMTLSDPYNLSFKELNKQMKSTCKEIIVRPGDVILTEEIVNAQATLFTDSRKKKECLEKTISLSPSISSRNYALIEKMSLQSDFKNVSKVGKKTQKSRVKRNENIRSAKRQEDSSKVVEDIVSQHTCQSKESQKDDCTEKAKKNIFEKESDKNSSSNSKPIKEERGTSDDASKAIVDSEESAVKFTEGVIAELKLLTSQNVLLEQGQSDIDPKEISSKGYQGLEVISQSKSENTFTERANEQNIVCEGKEQRSTDKITEGVVDEVKLLSPQNVLLEQGQSDIDPKEISSNGYQGFEIISPSKIEYTFTERVNEQNIVCEDKEQRISDKITESVVAEVKLLSPQNVIDTEEISSTGYQGLEVISQSKSEYTFTERANEQNIVCEDKEQRSADKITEVVVDEVKLLSPQNVLLEQGQSDIDPKEISSNGYQGFEIISPSKIEYTFTERVNEQNIVCEDKEQRISDKITESVVAEVKLLSPQNVIDTEEISSTGYQGLEVISQSKSEYTFTERANEQNIVCEDKEQRSADKITEVVVDEVKLLSPQNVLLEQGQSDIDPKEISSNGYQGFEIISPSKIEYTFTEQVNEQNIVCEDNEQRTTDKITEGVVDEVKLLSPQNVLLEQGQPAIDPEEISSHVYQGFKVISPSQNESIFTDRAIEERNIVCENKDQIVADKITVDVVAELKLLSPQNVLLEQGQSAIDPVEISSQDYQGFEVISPSKSEYIFTEGVIEEQNIACEDKGQIAADKITDGLVAELKLLSPQSVLLEQGQSAIDPEEISSNGYQGFEVISPSKSEHVFTERTIEEENIICEGKEQIAADKITEDVAAELKLLSPQNVLLEQGQSAIDPVEISSHGYQGFEVISPSKSEHIFTERTIEEENIIYEGKEQIAADKITEDVAAELKLLSPQNVLLEQGQSAIDPVEISSHGYQGFEVISPSKREHIFTERTIEEENIICEDKEQIAADKITEDVAAELKLLSPQNVLLEQGQSAIDPVEISSHGYQVFEVISPSKSEHIFTERTIEEENIICEDKEQIAADKITEDVAAELKLLSPQNVLLEQGQSAIDPVEISSNGYQGFEVISPSKSEYIFTERTIEEENIIFEDKEQITAHKITEDVVAELKLLSPQNVLLERGQSAIDPEEISSNGYQGFEVISPSKSEYIFTEQAIEEQKIVFEDKEQITAHKITEGVIAELKLLSPQNISLEQGQSAIDPQEISSNGYQGFEVISPSKSEYIFTEPANEEQIIVCEDKEQRTADKITEGVIAELKLLSPQNVLLEHGQSAIDPKEISSHGYQGFEVLSPNQSEYIFTERAIEKQNTVCKDKEQRTAELLDSAIERVLGISPAISQTKPKAQNIEIAEIKQRNLPKTTTEQLDYAIDAILGQKNKAKQNSTPSTSIAEENKCSNNMPSENIIDNEFEQSTAHILDQSVDIVLGHCSSPKNYLESQLPSDTTESVFKRNVCKPEEALYESMKVMNKKYFTDMKTVSANVPEALFADDDSDNSNSESGGEELKFFTPILSLDDLLTKKTDEILEIPSCTNSDFNCDQEPPVAFGSPEETRECLVTPNFSIELEVATSRSVNESANKNISDLSSISDIIPLGIPIDLIMTNETFADVMDIMLLDQVQQSIEYTTSGKSQVEKTNNQISIPVSSQKHNVCTSEILESCTSTNNACPDTMAIDQEILYSTINPLDEVEVSTNNGFDLHGNVTVEDLLADDGDDLFAFSELDKTRSRSNSYLNDSESCSNSPQEVVESLEITTKAIACDHSYNKEIKYPECTESVPNMFDSKLKSHPSPFWKVLKNNDMKTSTPKRDSALQKHVNNDKVNKISGGTSESLTVSPEKIQAHNPSTQNKPQPKLKWHSAPHGKVLKNDDSNTPVKPEPALIEHKDDHVIKKVFENTVDSPRVSREIKLAPKNLFNNIPEPELDHVRFPSPDLTNVEENSIMSPKDGDKSIAKTESSSLPILLKQSYSPSTITQPIITIQSQTNRLQRIDPIPKKDQTNHDYKEFSSNLNVSTIESNFRDQSKHFTKVEDLSIKETKNNISLKRENTPTLDEPPYKKHCPKTSKKLLTSDDIFNILKSKSLVACKPPLKHEVVSSCSFPNTVVTETRKDRPSNEQTYAETRRKTRSETSGKSMFEKPVSTENIVENIRKNSSSKGNTSHMKPETFVHVGKSVETSHKKEDHNSIIEFEVKYAESKELGEPMSSTSTKSDKSISTTQTHKNPSVVNKETRYSTRSSMEFAKMFVKKVSEKPAYIPPIPKRDSTMKFIPKPSADPIVMSPKLSPKQSPIFLVSKTEGPYTEPLVKHSSTPSPTSVYNRHHPYHNSPNSMKPSRNQQKYQRAASFVESKQPTNSHTSVATIKKQEHKHNSTPSPTSVYNRHHPYHNSPNSTKPSRNQQKYQRAATFVESKQPTNSHTSVATIKKQEPAKPASEQKLHQTTTRSSKMSPITSLPHNTALNTKLVVDNVKLCEAEEAELAAILEDYKRNLPVAKEYREHREQTRLLRLYEEKLRVEFLERKKNHIKQSQNLMAESKCLKRRPYVEPYDKNYMKPIFPPASNAISSTSRHIQHHSQPMHYKPSHTGQKYINKFGEIEKNIAFGRNGTDAQPKTPLTITTAWEHKSASVDEIMEHLAKMKKT